MSNTKYHKTSDLSLVVAIRNRHSRRFGRPPARYVRPKDGGYVGYFEDSSGDQFLLTIDPKEKTGILRSGDNGWDEKLPIKDGRMQKGIFVDAQVACWLSCAWKSATGQEFDIQSLYGVYVGEDTNDHAVESYAI